MDKDYFSYPSCGKYKYNKLYEQTSSDSGSCPIFVLLYKSLLFYASKMAILGNSKSDKMTTL